MRLPLASVLPPGLLFTASDVWRAVALAGDADRDWAPLAVLFADLDMVRSADLAHLLRRAEGYRTAEGYRLCRRHRARGGRLWVFEPC